MPAALAAVILVLPLAHGSRVTGREATESSTAESENSTADGSQGSLAETRQRAFSAAAAARAAGERPAAAGGQAAWTLRDLTHYFAPPSGVHGEDEKAQAVRMFIKKLEQHPDETTKDSCWLKGGDLMGCRGDCKCGMLEQCYPKFISMGSVDEGFRVDDVGVCGTAMPVLMLVSALFFVVSLGAVVMARMYFQFRESQAADSLEGLQQPKSLLLPGGTEQHFPPMEKADDTPVAVPWPEGEGNLS